MTGSLYPGLELTADDLRQACDLGGLAFERTDQLVEGVRHLGQERAIEAIRFALQMRGDGYNLFVLGPAGSQRHRLAAELARTQAATQAAPDDWCYVNNFADPKTPRALRFPAGQGSKFRNDIRELIDELRLAIPAAFEGDDYRNQVKAIEADVHGKIEEQWKALQQDAAAEGIGVLQTPTGYVLAPVRDGRVVSEEDFQKLPEAERQKTQAAIRHLGEQLQAHIERIPVFRKEHRERLKALDRDVTTHAVGLLLKELKARYQELPVVLAYLEEVERDIIDNAQNFREPESSPLPFLPTDHTRTFGSYEVNLFVSNDPASNAPVLEELNPSHQNVIGKVEHRAEMGALVTDFRLVRPGALHRANGGYLLLDIDRLLTRPFVWEDLKRSLFSKCVRIESPADTYGLVSTTTLQPEAIPLDVKVILIGERWLYYLLSTYDPEFNELFQVAADVVDKLKRNHETTEAYAHLIADRIREDSLLPFSRSAVERVIEERARRAEDSERLSMHMRSLNDLLRQADFWARQDHAVTVDLAHVVRALEQKQYRLNRVQSLTLEAIERNLHLIDTSGACVGQINALSVVEMGDFRFGHPVRITATTRMGSGDVVDIEREVELGGALHSKGMLILSSALSARYAADIPLSLRASVVFEQSYGGVDGDSASVAELCALLSSIAKVPIKQCLAVTGSINQLGRVQVVGGINEKIEGFFKVCETRGLDGSHGVIIPRENVKNLMLSDSVRHAVRDGTFKVYAVQYIDEALGLLTGIEAGERNDAGDFPPDSVNARIEQQLIKYAQVRQSFVNAGAAHESE